MKKVQVDWAKWNKERRKEWAENFFDDFTIGIIIGSVLSAICYLILNTIF